MDCYALLDLHNDKIMLFVPKLDNLYKIWMNFLTQKDAEEKYEVPVFYMEELEEKMKAFASGTLHIISGTNSDSGLEVTLPHEKYIKYHTGVVD